jgi:phosphate transport system substrate-binding protein
MRKFRLETSFCLLSAWIAVRLLSAAPAFGETLHVPGTGACEPVMAALAEAFNRGNPAEQVVVPPSTGSGGGIEAVLRGEAFLARVARRLKAKEEEQGLVAIPFARDRVVFVVGRQVKVTNLSSEQLAAIFSGKIDHWKGVGGPEGKIRVIVREPGDSSLGVILEKLPAFKNIVFSPEAKVILFDQGAVEALDKYGNAIGFITTSSMKWSKGRIRPISLDGVAPTWENVRKGKYPLIEEFTLVCKKDPKPLAGKFINFVFSTEGKKVIETHGLLSVERR